ncbi:MAG: TRAP transporter small permease [Succinivibrio sp.]|nr:TRAP transporter small permease [Succinivibrio sp.]
MNVLKLVNDKLEEWLIVLLLANIVVWVFVQVVLRYIFAWSLPWSEELVRWCFVWFIWVGVSYGFKVRKHICIDVLVNKLPVKAGRTVTITVNAVILWCLVKMAIYGIEQIYSPIIARQNSIVLFWPFTERHVSMFYLYASMPVGAALSCVRIVQSLIFDIRNFNTPQEAAA